MKPIAVAAFLALSLVCIATPVFAVEPEDAHVAMFKNVAGPMKVVRQDQSLDAKPGMTLFVSDRVVSGPGGSAGIVFKDGTLVTVGAASEIQLREYAFETKDAKFQFGMYLAKGSAIYSSGKIGKLAPDAVRIDTPTTTVGVRGTRFIVTAE